LLLKLRPQEALLLLWLLPLAQQVALLQQLQQLLLVAG
jgi:hypothetical protein